MITLRISIIYCTPKVHEALTETTSRSRVRTEGWLRHLGLIVTDALRFFAFECDAIRCADLGCHSNPLALSGPER